MEKVELPSGDTITWLDLARRLNEIERQLRKLDYSLKEWHRRAECAESSRKRYRQRARSAEEDLAGWRARALVAEAELLRLAQAGSSRDPEAPLATDGNHSGSSSPVAGL